MVVSILRLPCDDITHCDVSSLVMHRYRATSYTYMNKVIAPFESLHFRIPGGRWNTRAHRNPTWAPKKGSKWDPKWSPNRDPTWSPHRDPKWGLKGHQFGALFGSHLVSIWGGCAIWKNSSKCVSVVTFEGLSPSRRSLFPGLVSECV